TRTDSYRRTAPEEGHCTPNSRPRVPRCVPGGPGCVLGLWRRSRKITASRNASRWSRCSIEDQFARSRNRRDSGDGTALAAATSLLPFFALFQRLPRRFLCRVPRRRLPSWACSAPPASPNLTVFGEPVSSSAICNRRLDSYARFRLAEQHLAEARRHEDGITQVQTSKQLVNVLTL